MISIIIITYNGATKLPRLLRSIDSLDLREVEVILVDDGSTDHTLSTVRELSLGFPIKIISQKNGGRAKAKNAGAAHANYSLLWFLDDDMRVLPETLDAHRNHHMLLPGTICVGSTIEDAEYVKTDIQRYRFTITNAWKSVIETWSNPLTVENLFITSANFSISKDDFERLGGFDHRLRDAEDLDLAYRVYLANIPIYYKKEAIGFHMDVITCYSFVTRNRQYTKGYEILRNFNPGYYDINKRMHLSKPTGYRKFVLSMISQPLFIWLVDHFNIFLLLPKKIRYKFYELLIFGTGRFFTQRKLLNG